MLSIGIVGLPNVGKSTLFNALTRSKQADAANYPFCTIEPNVGIVEVPDGRLQKLTVVSKSEKTVPTAIQFVDIAGLVKGASEGEGLGNKFLSHIREVDAIAHVVRGFSDKNVTHVHGDVNPKTDAEVINLELVIADAQTTTKHLEKLKAKAKGVKAKELEQEISVCERLSIHLQAGNVARRFERTEAEDEIIKQLHLLTEKPIMYIINLDEGTGSIDVTVEEGVPHIPISAKLEAELVDLSPEEAATYMKELGMEQTGLDKIVIAGYALLNLITFFTSGVQETRAWTVTKGTKGPQAAGVIHTDFVKGYVKAEVAKCEDFLAANGWVGVKEIGKMRLEGKEYVVSDGDVCYFHIA